MGKSRILLFLSVFVLLAAHSYATEAARDTSSETFKYYMHRIYDNYSSARVSITLKRRDIADIQLKHMQEAILMAQDHIPSVKKDGTRLDRRAFIDRINRMQSMVTDLRAAVKYEEPVMTKSLPEEIFNMCVTCHKEAKLEYLFRLPRRATLFGEYMHRVSDSLDLARINLEENGSPREVEDQLKLMNYYIDLLKEAFPEEGPSGVIMDKDNFNRRIAAVSEKGKLASARFKEKKKVDLDTLRGELNGLCVACHEPERIK